MTGYYHKKTPELILLQIKSGVWKEKKTTYNEVKLI